MYRQIPVILLIKKYFIQHRRFIIQATVLSLLIALLFTTGSHTKKSYTKPYSKTDSLIASIQHDNQLLLAENWMNNISFRPIFSLPKIEISHNPAILIHSRATTTRRQLHRFILANNPALDENLVSRVIETYIQDCALEGINHDIAISQMCLETGYLRFKGAVKAAQFNFCGLGAVGNQETGVCFASIEEGIRAHVQHLKAYASREPLMTKLVDTRFSLVKRGSAPDIQALSGTWASDPQYGDKLEAMLRCLTRNAATSNILANGS